MAGNKFLIEMLHGNTNKNRDLFIMSPQLTLSSLFCVLALALLCVVTTLGDVAGTRNLAQVSGHGPAQVLVSMQAEANPGPQLS